MARMLGQLTVAALAVLAASYFAVITPTIAGPPESPWEAPVERLAASPDITAPAPTAASPKKQRICPPLLPGGSDSARRFPQRRETGPMQRAAYEAAPRTMPVAEAPMLNIAGPAPQASSQPAPVASISLSWKLPAAATTEQAVEGALVVQNRGAAMAHEVVVQAELPAGLMLNGSEPPAEADGTICTWNLGQLDAGASRRIALQLTPTGQGNLVPTATVRSTTVAAGALSVIRPQLELTATANSQWQLGRSETLAFTVVNRGEATSNIELVVSLPEGLQHPDGPEVHYALGALGPGESRPIEITCTPAAAGEYDIQGTVHVGNSAVADASCAVVVERPTLELTAAGPKVRYVGRPASYTFEVHNPGPAATSNVRLAAELPPGLRFVSAGSGGGFDAASRQVTWFLGRLEPQTKTTVTLNVAAEAPGEQPLTASATGDGGATASVEGVIQVEGVAALEIELVSADDAVEIGAETVHELRLTNRGSKPATNLEVALRLGDELDATGASGATEAKCDSGDVVFAPLAALEPGESTTFSVHLRGAGAGKGRATAYARCAEQPDVIQAECLVTVYED
ncbi:MAG: DUF11 domain-containing protein [Pirellulales bacterium]|nr:DUF11 domain-containing protein [Pirellulales bacterium]